MSNLYETIQKLCKSRNITIAALERECELGNATIKKWANSTPSGDRLAKVADHFGVTVDYLLGRRFYTSCKICDYSYDPLSETQVKDHEEYHKKHQDALERYKLSEIIDFPRASNLRNKSIHIFNKYGITREERLAAFDDFLKAEYSLYLRKNGFELSCEDFDTFCKKEVGLASTKECFDDKDDEFYQVLVDKYGVLEDNEYHQPYNGETSRVLSYYNQLNDFGKKEAEKRLEELAQIVKYTTNI